jgi:8-oxo-dGTP diphosphatase
VSTVNVVAAVIWKDGRIYAAHRTHGELLGWEFPGGKVEKDETPEQALRREVREELGLELSATWYLDTVERDYPTFHLHMDVYVCIPLEGSEPHSNEHDAERWLSQDELLDVDWLPADADVARSLGMAWDEVFTEGRF